MLYLPEDKILGKRLLFLTAHPDDESYTASGTMIKNNNSGGSNFLICATFGEKGISHLRTPVTNKELRIIRKKELFSVSKFLRIKKLFALGFSDGRVDKNYSRLKNKVLFIAKKIQPDIIISFGRDGITGHRDHIAVSYAAEFVARNIHIPLLKITMSPKLAPQAPKWFKLRRRSPHYEDNLMFAKPTVKIKVNPLTKLKAILHHKSQLDAKSAYKGIPKYAVRESLAWEYFA